MKMWRAAMSFAILAASGCGMGQPGRSSARPDLVFLTQDGCVNTRLMRGNLDAALSAMGRAVAYTVVDVATLAAGDVRGGYGTPTVLNDGRDLFGMPVPNRPNPAPT